MLIEYKRKGKPRTKEGKLGTANARTKKGIMVAFPNEDEGIINFGFSLCCFRKNGENVDEFDIEFGKKMAIERALSTDRPLCIPSSMTKQFKRFVEKCNKRYKQLSLKREIVYMVPVFTTSKNSWRHNYYVFCSSCLSPRNLLRKI
jgi:hypothetical protein